jgi:hypothetical protein
MNQFTQVASKTHQLWAVLRVFTTVVIANGFCAEMTVMTRVTTTTILPNLLLITTGTLIDRLDHPIEILSYVDSEAICG